MAAEELKAKREQIVYKAKLAEQAERYDEMAEYMKEVAQMGEELTVEERNLLSVAYKNAVGARRASWRIISSVEQKEKGKNQADKEKHASAYRQKVEDELNKICEDILKLLDEHLIKAATTSESKVFYYKMMGDYYRYISEFSAEGDKKDAADKAQESYESATSIATKELSSTHPIRLGLALNFSVFFYEIMNHPEMACSMAQKAFDEAISELDSVSEESYKDSTLIMQLLRDNLTLWTSDAVNDAGGKEEGGQ
eukprot:GHVQ01034569.1.p1 GENE.GHVQ01034569.1~~GHVQ01034569.1.p1  ORF type:complete len:254 (-),score=58.49 GHVQ01034569.1:292-1053(-)